MTEIGGHLLISTYVNLPKNFGMFECYMTFIFKIRFYAGCKLRFHPVGFCFFLFFLFFWLEKFGFSDFFLSRLMHFA